MATSVSAATVVPASACSGVPVSGGASIVPRQPTLGVGVVLVALVIAFLVQSVYRHGFFCNGWWWPIRVSILLTIAVVILHSITRFISITIVLRRAVPVGEGVYRQGLVRRADL